MKKTKILIVEDEAIVALDLQLELKKLNYEVTGIVQTQSKVFNSIKENEPDVILMDINLGNNENGIHIVQELQKVKDIPIIYNSIFE